MTTDIFSDLALQRYVVTSLNLESKPGLYGEKVTGGELGLGLEVATETQTKNQYRLTLTVSVNEDDRAYEEHGIRLSATIVGFFVWRQQDPSDSPCETDMELVTVNGMSILYSTLRPIMVILAQQAGRHRFALPTVDMRKHLADTAGSTVVNLDALTVVELRELAKQRGVETKGLRRRDEIIEAFSR